MLVHWVKSIHFIFRSDYNLIYFLYFFYFTKIIIFGIPKNKDVTVKLHIIPFLKYVIILHHAFNLKV